MAASVKPDGTVTVLGKDAQFEGKLTFDGEVQIEGRFSGEIFSKERLQINLGAKVQAEITAGTVVVFGDVTGNIKASQAVELKSNAKLRGNLETATLTIERGALFEGSCKMENIGKGSASVTPLMKAAEDKK